MHCKLLIADAQGLKADTLTPDTNQHMTNPVMGFLNCKDKMSVQDGIRNGTMIDERNAAKAKKKRIYAWCRYETG
ncbi:hypothetical protein RY831_11080 [Noviherbaspirillum sp. CPCC 100848]|uniref:Uncharacterized protein n=1 Tax=Noviherbaspirillum album TaxID=3080276 RepID=A0ABU6J7T1_9BURK|nr:hypothetical protein [Noviherbaspirillum sp. CPCC 100848]MEC4719693.1 hypothetical protein [Noviherbaspirillum sp. CPCC 100848]